MGVFPAACFPSPRTPAEAVALQRAMAARVVDRQVRDEILQQDLSRLVKAYTREGQRGAERFVLQGTKAGDLALDMEASFTEEDLLQSVD